MMGYQNSFYEQCRNGFFGMGWMGTLTIVLIVFMIIILFVMKRPGTNQVDEALTILNRKFATGEITEEEYQHRKQLLKRK
jgi:putative membrane protein